MNELHICKSMPLFASLCPQQEAINNNLKFTNLPSYSLGGYLRQIFPTAYYNVATVDTGPQSAPVWRALTCKVNVRVHVALIGNYFQCDPLQF